jgi:hypothetical protein
MKMTSSYVSNPVIDAVNDFLSDVPGVIADTWKGIVDGTITVTPLNSAELVSALEHLEASAAELSDLIAGKLDDQVRMN